MGSDSVHAHPPIIVYVEDNKGDVELLQEALREREYHVKLIIFDSGEEALSYFHVRASARDIPPPHCVLLDEHLPVILGTHLFRFLRTTAIFDKTAVYLFMPETQSNDLITAHSVSKESFLTKPKTWDGCLALADLLMRSVTANIDHSPASPGDSRPEAHAEGDLRRHDTLVQRDRIKDGPGP